MPQLVPAQICPVSGCLALQASWSSFGCIVYQIGTHRLSNARLGMQGTVASDRMANCLRNRHPCDTTESIDE